MPDFDIKKQVGQNRKQTTRRVEWPVRVDFSKINGGAGLTDGDTAAIFTLKAGYVHEYLDCIIRKQQTGAGDREVNVGVPGALTKLATEIDLSAAVNTLDSSTNGDYFPENTDVVLSVPAQGGDLDEAVVDLVFVGYMISTD